MERERTKWGISKRKKEKGTVELWEIKKKKKCIMEAMCRNIETIAENIKDYSQSSDPESQREGHRNVRRLKNLLNSNIRGDC